MSVKGGGSSLNSTKEFRGFSCQTGIDNSGRSKKYQKETSGSGEKHSSTEILPASLYVPRNEKQVKINGNLIIHSVLASETAVAQANSKGHVKQSSEEDITSPAIIGHVVSDWLSQKVTGWWEEILKGCRNSVKHIRALASDSHDNYVGRCEFDHR